MALKISFDQALDIWRGASVDAVRTGRPDLTMRQMALLLTVYMKAPPHTVRGLAAALNVSKPAVVRALDRLEELGFARREEDPEDGRNVLVNRTVQGSVYLRETGDLIAAAALKAER
ncbi:MAG TPA: MarR family transcriptional regulator [Alphaproteobacteria bacterium]|nr:MarR family transcriptional regulator [Alphaproteobacteria bacterium]